MDYSRNFESPSLGGSVNSVAMNQNGGNGTLMDQKLAMENNSRRAGNQKATFSGMTAIIGVVALVVDIISVAVPNWGYFGPGGKRFITSGFSGAVSNWENSGHFGPFQSCKSTSLSSFCGHAGDLFQPSTWLIVAGICAIAAVISLFVFCAAAVLHVSMQLQRKEILVSFSTALLAKLIASAVAAFFTLAAVALGAMQFSVGSRSSYLKYSIGICYYLQIVLLMINIFLIVLSYVSFHSSRRHPANNIVSRQHRNSGRGTSNGTNGLSTISGSAAAPYRLPNNSAGGHFGGNQYNGQQIQAGVGFHSTHQNSALANGYDNGAFVSATLQVPPSSQAQSTSPQGLGVPLQAIRPIQMVQGIPQSNFIPSQPAPQVPYNGQPQPQQQPPVIQQPQPVPGQRGPNVSLVPGGKNQAHFSNFHGSMDSINSNNSSTLSETLSFNSTISTGSATGHGPLRSSLKKNKNKDKVSINSESSSKRVRLSLGSEQTSV